MRKPVVIAFCSPVMRSGKSAAAAHLVEQHGFKLLKFAAPLKDMTRALLPHLGLPANMVEAHVEGGLKESAIDGFEGLTTRRLMQTIGTEWGRDTIAQDFWARIVFEAANRHLRRGTSVVIDDMRFRNELETVERLKGQAYRIVRPDAQQQGGSHVSEGELDGIHLPEIWNRQDLPRLYEKLDLIIREL